MEYFFRMLNLQLMLLTLMVVGIVLVKVKMLNAQSRKVLSALLVNLLLPANIIASFISNADMSAELLLNFLWATVISFIVQYASLIISKPLFKKSSSDRKALETYGMLVSNSSYIGIPVAESLYGSMATTYTAIFQLPIRITMWTSGVSLFTKLDRKSAIKQIFLHPCIVSIYIGMILMFTPVNLPVFLYESVQSLSRCVTPVSMIVVGAIMCDADLKTLFTKQTLWFSFWRLIAFPLAIYLILLPFHLDLLLLRVSVILSAMPAATITSIMADKYDCDPEYAAKIVVVSVILSMFTIPMFAMLI